MQTRQNSTSTIFFAHSAGAQYGPGKGSYDLVKYLKAELRDRFRILSPVIEKPNSPTYHKFKELYKQAFAKISGPAILIGHSLGASTLLQFLSEEKAVVSILGLFLVSTPHWKSDMKEFQLKENFQRSLKDIPAVFLYHSEKDNVVPVDHLKFYEKAFGNAMVRKIKGGEHIFSKGLPELVADIRSL
ncbi:MAG: alpha/beta hydrolase [Chitinophagaceae bacterium]